uniref:hypothetical protein n=1 Tax=Burkholderia pseudomallei TaxID=28450 RepID=UPI00387964CD
MIEPPQVANDLAEILAGDITIWILRALKRRRNGLQQPQDLLHCGAVLASGEKRF